MANAAELLESYIYQGGKDLGEFLLGSEGRAGIEPAANPNHVIGNFEGLQQQIEGNFADVSKHIGAAKSASLKRMIGNNHISYGDTVDSYSTNLGFEQGGKHDAMFWFLARGDKSLPSIDEQTDAARKALREEGADPQQIARDLANNLLARSGYTPGKLGRMGPAKGMIKELSRSENYEFSVERADQLSKALVPEQARKARTIGNALLGIDRQKTIGDLLDDVEQDEKTFGDVIKQMRLQRRQTQREFGEKFTRYIKRHELVEDNPTINQSMVQKWEKDLVPFQTEEMVNAIAKFLGFKEEHDRFLNCIPAVPNLTVALEDQVTAAQWMEKIRSGDVTLADYIGTTMREEGLNYVDFGKTMPLTDELFVGPGAISKWMRGGVATTKHAEALAKREGYTEPEDVKDFLAFARTGKLDRTDRSYLLKQFLDDGISLAEFVFTIRSEEGQTPEECDEMIGLGRGAVRNIEKGRELRNDNAAILAEYMQPELGERRQQFLERALAKGKYGPSYEGIDPTGYQKLLEKSLELGSVRQLRAIRQLTPDIHFNHHDPVVEVWWRNKALQTMMNPDGTQKDHSQQWNDLHDLLFGQVNKFRLETPRFADNVSDVMRLISEMGDSKDTRRAMNATLYRQVNDEATAEPPKRRAQIALATVTLNTDFMRDTIHYENAKYSKTKLDEDNAYGKACDVLMKIMEQDYIKDLVAIDSYISRSVINSMHNIARTKKREAGVYDELLPTSDRHRNSRPILDDDILYGSGQYSSTPKDPFETTGVDILAMLVEGMDKLTKASREVLDGMLNLPPGTKNVYAAVKDHIDHRRLARGENEIPMNTVRTRIHRMRKELANMDELKEAVEDLFGADMFDDGPGV